MSMDFIAELIQGTINAAPELEDDPVESGLMGAVLSSVDLFCIND